MVKICYSTTYSHNATLSNFQMHYNALARIFHGYEMRIYKAFKSAAVVDYHKLWIRGK